MRASSSRWSPSRSHHFDSQRWHEQKMTSDPSGSVSSIWMTESLPHSAQSNPVVGSCLPIVRKSSAVSRKAPIGVPSSQQKWSLISRSCRFAAGRSGHGSTGNLAGRDRIAPYLRSAIFPALAASRRAARATAPQMILSIETGSLPIAEPLGAKSTDRCSIISTEVGPHFLLSPLRGGALGPRTRKMWLT